MPRPSEDSLAKYFLRDAWNAQEAHFARHHQYFTCSNIDCIKLLPELAPPTDERIQLSMEAWDNGRKLRAESFHPRGHERHILTDPDRGILTLQRDKTL